MYTLEKRSSVGYIYYSGAFTHANFCCDNSVVCWRESYQEGAMFEQESCACSTQFTVTKFGIPFHFEMIS